MFNKKGEALTAGFIAVAIAVGSIASLGFYKTAKNGVLQNNGKIIWCKMQNKGADHCDAKYLPFPKTEGDV